MLLSKVRKGEEPGGGLETDAYARFLGLETDFVLRGNDRKRTQLVTDVASHPERHLFLDPYTGIGLYRDPETGRVVQRKGTNHITGEELGKIANGRQGKVVLVFDHAYLRVKGTAREKVEAKLNLLSDLHDLELTKLKPRWDVHLSGDDEHLGCVGASRSSVLGE